MQILDYFDSSFILRVSFTLYYGSIRDRLMMHSYYSGYLRTTRPLLLAFLNLKSEEKKKHNMREHRLLCG